MADNRITTVYFGASKRAKAPALHQYDYGQTLRIKGVALPDAYEVHFSNSEYGGTTTTAIGNADGVAIPDAYLQNGASIFAWIYLHDSEDDGETEYKIEIPVFKRPKPTNETPTPVQQDVITQAIAALNAGVERAEQAADGIEDTIETALQEAKDSGEFDGPQGEQGEQGEKGDPGDSAVSVDIATVTMTVPCDTTGRLKETAQRNIMFSGRIGGELVACKLKTITRNQPTTGVNVTPMANGTDHSVGYFIVRTTVGALPYNAGVSFGSWSLTFEVNGQEFYKTFQISAIQDGNKGDTGDPWYADNRVTSLDNTQLAIGTVIEAIGAPVYVKNIETYSEYGITQTGWYVFARINAKDGVSVTSATTITGAAGQIVTVGASYVDVAVRFGSTAESQTVVVNWGESAETFVFKAGDLAVRNLDYRTTFYLYDLDEFIIWTYALTTDTAFVANKSYYTKDGDVYTLAEVTVGESIPADTYYNHSKARFEGMTRNVTYKLDTIIDCPFEIVLPEVDDEGYGAWFEFQLRYLGSHSCTLLPPTGVKIGTVTTQAQTAGINVIDLQYTGVGGVKMWSLLNTHSNIPA